VRAYEVVTANGRYNDRSKQSKAKEKMIKIVGGSSLIINRET
jgi:hypothetical protein